MIEILVAGPGFINFKLKASYLSKWLESFSTEKSIQEKTKQWLNDQITVIDFPSANTAKQAHIGHLRPMVIGESIARILEFSGAKIIRDNHIGDWGTNFGTLIMILKEKGIQIAEFTNPSQALELIDSLYKEGTTLENKNPELRDVSRNELLKLQNGDPENTQIWQSIIDVSNQAFEKLFEQLEVKIDYTLGESFYKDKVQRIYDELLSLEIAEESDGALVVWHNEIKKFAKNAEFFWCQEEPKNMGAWFSVRDYIQWTLNHIGAKYKEINYIGRDPAASPATGYAKRHLSQQKKIIETVFK